MSSSLHWFLVALLIVQCRAQIPANVNVDQAIPATDARCVDNSWTLVNRASAYVSTFTGRTSICVRSYVDVCNTVTGVVPCNMATSACQNVGYEYSNTALFPSIPTTGVPQVCAVASQQFLSDTRVLSVAQIVFAFLTYVPSFILIAYVAWRSLRVSGFASAILCCQLVFALLLSFSFLYLSGLVKLAGSLVAVSLYRCRCPLMTGLGILFLIAVFFWSTFRWGLGHDTHDRFTASATDFNFFQNQCNNFYSGHFTFLQDLYSITANPALGPVMLCSRYWVAAIFCFEFLSQLMLVLLAACGIHSLPFQSHIQKRVVANSPDTIE